ncbi:hypothetical protein L9F63_001089, partial [Diploptera punctata]
MLRAICYDHQIRNANVKFWANEVLVSPVLAGLAVGIGVPILLFYVYGVVPVSLCRSGGCGVSTSGAGVRFDFDDETDLLGVLGARNTDAVSMDAVSHRGGNPSIGEVSLSLGSGSQLERLGRENDRESASNVALAGASIAGSIASSLLPGGQRLEVQADVASTQRFSMSSETASAATSLSEKSVSVSIADDGAASTRALAGSVLNFKVDSNSLSGFRGTSTDGCTPVEVHTDSASQRSDEVTGPASLSSLEELTTGMARRTRRRPPLDRQGSESSSWTAGGEDGGSERVRFDDHVSFIAPHSYEAPHSTQNVAENYRMDKDDDVEEEDDNDVTACNSKSDLAAEKLHGVCSVNGCSKPTSSSALRNVFFHAPTTETKRLPKMRKTQECVGQTSDGEQQNSARQTPTLPVIPEPSIDQPHSSPQELFSRGYLELET